MRKIILAIDPGKKKCGIALVDYNLRYIEGEVTINEELIDRIKYYIGKYHPDALIVGSGTNSESIITIIKNNFPEFLIIPVKEKDTTWLARKYFFQYHPPLPLTITISFIYKSSASIINNL
jgi:RNase H-fold protein (predicted Holliday junction resolvase)